jgi:hypothetical protein
MTCGAALAYRGCNCVTVHVCIGRGVHPAIVRANARAFTLSVTPGKSRRNSSAADSSPPSSKAVRIAAASAALTVNIVGVLGCPSGRATASAIGVRPDHMTVPDGAARPLASRQSGFRSLWGWASECDDLLTPVRAHHHYLEASHAIWLD